MAAFDSPWLVDMSSDPTPDASSSSNPPTIAAFSPASASPASRSTFQVHQKSPLLVATPPRVTQALSKSYSWLQALNWLLGLLTWTSPDPWESFLLVALFWGIGLYGDLLLRTAGNLLGVVLIIAGMFLRRYREAPKTTTLDEILATLNTLNARMELFFSPCLSLLNLLSTPTSATKATTRPALTALFIRILLVTPLWLALSVYPVQLITPRRITLFIGTLLLTFHSRPAKVSRTILWRSATLRNLTYLLTGLTPPSPPAAPNGKPRPPPLPPRQASSMSTATTTTAAAGVKFTFSIFENQRRWLGMGWTANLFPGERGAWTDEHLQPSPSPAEFTLPPTPGQGVAWMWVDEEGWEVEGKAGGKAGGSAGDAEGWWYYDNKWRDGRGGDGWGKYTRRRKWVRRAELVEVEPGMETGIVAREDEGEDDRGSEGGSDDESIGGGSGRVPLEVKVSDADADADEEEKRQERPGPGRPPPLPERKRTPLPA